MWRKLWLLDQYFKLFSFLWRCWQHYKTISSVFIRKGPWFSRALCHRYWKQVKIKIMLCFEEKDKTQHAHWTRACCAVPSVAAVILGKLTPAVVLILLYVFFFHPSKVVSMSTLSDRGRRRKRGESRGRPSRTTRFTNWRRGFCTRSIFLRPTAIRSRSSWGSPTRRSSPGSRTAGPNSSGTWRRWKRTWSR